MNIESVAMTIIAFSGDARTFAYQALEAAKSGNFERANQLIADAEKVSIEAHKAQTEILVAEANGECPDINVLLIHSQDHLMTSILAQELIKEIIYLHEHKQNN